MEPHLLITLRPTKSDTRRLEADVPHALMDVEFYGSSYEGPLYDAQGNQIGRATYRWREPKERTRPQKPRPGFAAQDGRIARDTAPLGKFHPTDEDLRVLDQYAAEADRLMVQAKRPCSSCRGRGIVTTAGGEYAAGAYVLIRLLRYLGCDLPVEVWCYAHEARDKVVRVIQRMQGVKLYPVRGPLDLDPGLRSNQGWALKAHAILKSRLRHVLWIDSDNYPVRDPSFLFDLEPYEESGFLAWPDNQTADGTGLARPGWLHLAKRSDDPPTWKEFESGQMVIDRRRRYGALLMADFFCRHGHEFFRHFYGDKEAFHAALLRSRSDFRQCPHPRTRIAGDLNSVWLRQHDWEGRPLFQHRCRCKFSLRGRQIPVPEFQHAQACERFLAELREEIDG